MAYKIYKIGRKREVVSTHQTKLEAVLALRDICTQLGGDYEMTAPVEQWKIYSKFGIFSPTKHTYYIIEK